MVRPRVGEVWRCGIITKYDKIPFTKLLGTLLIDRVSDTIVVGSITLLIFIFNFDFFVSFFAKNPALLEGLGYTPIEAALYGTQVLTNKSTALHETTLGLLNYYDPPTDAEAMSTEMERLLTMPVSKERLQKIVKTFRERYDNRSQTRELHDLILTLLENP